MFFAFFALSVCPVSAQSQGYWQTAWVVKDAAGNPISPNSDNSYTLRGAPTGAASNTYPAAITAIALGSPYTITNPSQTLDETWVLGCYSPNALTVRSNSPSAYLYGGPPVVVSGFNLNTHAANYSNYNGGWGSGWTADKLPAGYPLTSSGPLISICGSSHAEAQVQLSVFFNFTSQWVGSGPPTTPAPPPPPYLNLLLVDNLMSSASVSWPFGAADDGKGRKSSASMSVPSFSEQTNVSASDSVTSLSSASGLPAGGCHLVRAAVQGGIAQVYLDGNAVVDASNPLAFHLISDDDYWAPWSGSITYSDAAASATLSATVRPNSREVTISAGVDNTYMKAPAYYSSGVVRFDAYNNIVFTPVHHTPDLDGTMRGDMGIGYGTTGATPPADCQYPVNYTAHLKGFWGAASTYSWYSDLKSTSGAGPTFGNTYIGAATIPTNLGPPLIAPGETGKVDHIFLKVVDSNGGASATANYYMALHQPEEFLPSNQVTESIFKKKDEVETSAPGWATPGVGVNCTWNAPGAYWDYLSGGAAVMAEIPGADEALPWFGAFCAAAGVAVDHLKPLPCTGPVTFDPQNQGSDYPDETLHPFKTTDHRYFVMIPHFWDMYTRTHLLQDVWDKTGFVSETPINSDVFVRQAGSYGTYKYTTTLQAAVK